jgi:NADP-dependent 3-hydroxy acid dehydrogenase YdfG
MKIAITGHTQGIGLALAKKFEELGHTVQGFSRSNGYDISDDSNLDRIVSDSDSCDIFINNAMHGYAQTKLLYKIHSNWLDQNRMIVNMGSKVTMLWFKEHRDPEYRTQKKSLDDACEFLNNRSLLPKIMLIKPPSVETQRNQHIQKAKLSPEDFADLVSYCILHPKITISELGILRP